MPKHSDVLTKTEQAKVMAVMLAFFTVADISDELGCSRKQVDNWAGLYSEMPRQRYLAMQAMVRSKVLRWGGSKKRQYAWEVSRALKTLALRNMPGTFKPGTSRADVRRFIAQYLVDNDGAAPAKAAIHALDSGMRTVSRGTIYSALEELAPMVKRKAGVWVADVPKLEKWLLEQDGV